VNLLVVTLRLVHVVLGVLWVGAVVFTAVYLTPAVREAGPDGAKVMGALQRRGVLTVLPILAIATLLSGIWLYWRDSAGFEVWFITSPGGFAYGVGGVVSIVAYAIGIAVMRPAMLRATTLAQAGSGNSPAEQEQRAAEIQRLRARGAAAGRWVAALLVVAVAAMAVARYL
jgi:hypothetical protein